MSVEQIVLGVGIGLAIATVILVVTGAFRRKPPTHDPGDRLVYFPAEILADIDKARAPGQSTKDYIHEAVRERLGREAQ